MIVIVDLDYGNIGSIQYALKNIGAQSVLSHDKNQIRKASRIIIPGVGNAKQAMDKLKQLKLIETICSLTQPTLGICLGMQLLYEFSEEGDTDCLKIIPGKVEKFKRSCHLSIPHMGWNDVTLIQKCDLFSEEFKSHSENKDITSKKYFYFVHSYFAPIAKNTLATVSYGEPFSAIVQQNNFWGVQFHPEKSGELGTSLLKNFLRG